jgi:phospholipase C
MFVEAWLEAQGYKNIQSKEMPPWRREHMSNLLNAFDFDNVSVKAPHEKTKRISSN